MIDNLYDVSLVITGTLPPEMQFINAVITLCLAALILIAFVAPFAMAYMFSSYKKIRW